MAHDSVPRECTAIAWSICVYSYWQEDWKHIERCIFNYAETTRSDSDYYVGNTVRELCLTRSADFILDTAELNLLIHHLCTS